MHGFYGRFLESVKKYPELIAVELQRASGAVESVSYAELHRRGESVANWLRSSGLTAGARCAIIAPNAPRWVAAYLGIMASGGVVVPLDTSFNAQQVSKLLRDSGSTFLFTDARLLPVVEKAVEGTSVRVALLEQNESAKYPCLPQMFAAGPGDFRTAAIADTDLALIMYTSGTTSDPKGVILTHSNLLAEAASVFEIIQVGHQDSILAVLPLFHSLAQLANLLLPFAVGARVVYLESLNTTELVRALTERGITLFVCVPQFFYLIHERVMQTVKQRSWPARAAFRTMMALSAGARALGINLGKVFFRKVHLLLGPKMRFLITGGSAFDISIGRDLRKLGFNVLQAYGLTESSGAATVTRPDNNVMGSVGQPLRGVEIRIIDPQPGEDIPYPVGEIVIRGDIIMPGYYNRADATAETIRDGGLYTGDLGYIDQRGNLFVTGRKKEMIVLSSGKNIYPEEIEAHYLRSPFIKEICVLGLKNRPGEPVSERLHAVIVPDFEVLRARKIVNAREVIRFDVENLSMQLPAAKRILSFDIWPDPLPRTTTRKLKRFAILRRVQAEEPSAAEATTAAGEEPTAEEAVWLSDSAVQKAISVIKQAIKVPKPVMPASNLELDLGLDSMERVELVVALERELGSHGDDKVISSVYTVRELVDAILQGRGAAAPPVTQPGWEKILASGPDDPKVLKALDAPWLVTFFWFALGKFVSIFVRIFFRLEVKGVEKLPKTGPFILSPNHQSFMDGPVVAALIPWRLFSNMFYVGTSEIFGQGLFKYLGRSFKLVPVDPDSNLVNAMRAGAYGLRQGRNLVLYPEGERSIDGTPKKFKRGAAILSAHLKVPIYPVALEGFYEAWPRSKKLPRLSRLRVEFGDPVIPPQSFSNPEETYRQITDELRARVVTMWEGLREKV